MAASYEWAKNLAQFLGQNSFSERLLLWAEKQRRQEELEELCQRAMRRARFEPLHLRLMDIGLIAYRHPETPKLHRNSPVVTDTRWLRPFVELKLLHPSLEGNLYLQILDSKGRVLFNEGHPINLAGVTRRITKNWLPLQNLYASVQGRWSIVVRWEDQTLAIHPFEWVKLVKDDILDLVREDGEISPELQKEVRHGQFRPMSLDELLEGQED